MDAVELPLPANVTVGKLMASDGLDIGGDMEGRSLGRKEASVSHKGSGCGPCRIEYSRNKKVDEDSCVHDSLPSHSQCAENGKGHDIEKVDGHTPLSPDQEGKLLGRKYAKRPIGIPSKRPRMDDTENCMKITETSGHHSIFSKAGSDPIRCTLADKSQIVKLKRVHDGKKADKKFFRASLKNKYESLTSKAGLACSDTFSGGSNILGTHGSKSDLHDISKSLDELSLSELLDGSYKYPMLPMDKGKKSSNFSILLSVRKACSILCSPPHGVAENASNVKTSQSSQDPTFSTGSSSDCETKEKQLEELLTKGKDCLQANLSEFTMLQPKNILDQLGLPAVQELEAFLLNPSVTSVPVQYTAKAKSCNYTGMPPFPWSFSHGGNNKPSFEFCKVNSTKNLCQGKWVRIGSSTTTTEDDKSFSLGLVFKEYGHNVDSVNQQKIDDVLQVMRSFTSNLQPPSDGPSSKSIVMGTHPEVEAPEILNSVHGSSIPVSFNSKTFLPHEVTHSFNSPCLDSDSKDHASRVVSRCQGNEMNLDTSKFNVVLKDKAVLVESRTGTIDSCSVSSLNTGSDCSSWQLPNWEKYRQAYSPELLSAAATLCEMANCSDPMIAAKHSSGRIRWPKAPSMKTMKARKSSPSMDKPDRSFTCAGQNDLIKQMNIPPAKLQPATERKTDFVRPCTSGREAVRWSSVPIGAASPPHKLEKDQRLPHGNSTFRTLLTPLSSRVDKAYENQIRKAPAKPPSVAFEGSSIRDWIRGRNKRL